MFSLEFPYFFASAMGIAAIIGVVVSIMAFFDCLRRAHDSFHTTITPNKEYEKFLWIVVIVLTAKLWGVGAIAYYLYVKKRELTT